MSIQALNYEVEDMGRYFKSSKKKYKWTFSLDDKSHFLELEFSYLSGKRKLVLDGRVLHESMMLTSSFQYPFTLEGFALNVIQQGDAFELRINNKVFSHLFTQQKTQNEFVYEDKTNTKPDTFAYENTNNQFGNFNNVPNSNKFSLNFKMEPKQEQNFQVKTNAVKHTTNFGQNNAFEEFEQFGQPSMFQNSNNPFGSSFPEFDNPKTNTKQQAKVDLLDLDDPEPQPQPQTQPQQQPQQQDPFQQTFSQQQVQPTTIQQQSSPFDGFGWSQSPQQPPAKQISPPQQQVSTQPNLFEAFQTTPPQQQQATQANLNIMNLYGAQQQQPPVNNLAYLNFPSMNQPQNIPVSNQPQVATPFDLFK